MVLLSLLLSTIESFGQIRGRSQTGLEFLNPDCTLNGPLSIATRKWLSESTLKLAEEGRILPGVRVSAYSCEKFKKADDKGELTRAIQDLYYKMLEDAQSYRGSPGNGWNQCSARTESRALIITFSGTAEYAPALSSVMNHGLRCMNRNSKANHLGKEYFKAAQRALNRANAVLPKNNSINEGITPLFVSDPGLREQVPFIDFATFPSEEVDFLRSSGTQRAWDAMDAAMGDPGTARGLVSAEACVTEYLATARSLGITRPKIIVLGHSSGSRSTVKFIERMKTRHLNVDLAFTIDPVIEAHDELKVNFYKKVINNPVQNAGESIGVLPSQKEALDRYHTDLKDRALYKPSNAKRFVSVFQRVDTYGAGLVPDGVESAFSEPTIRGTYIRGADVNLQIKDFKKSGDGKYRAHGGIAKHQLTQDLFIKELGDLLR